MASAAEGGGAEDLESFTVPQLKERLKEAGLPVSGKKAELIARLQAAPSNGAKPEAAGSEASEQAPVPSEPEGAPAQPAGEGSEAAAASGDTQADAGAKEEHKAAKEADAGPRAENAKAEKAAKEADAGPRAENAKAEKESADSKPEAEAAEPKPEGTVARVARVWKEHIESSDDLKSADRLTMSSTYRTWVKTAELGLAEGEVPPPFTDVWMELNYLKRARPQETNKESREPESKRARGSDKGADGARYSEKEALDVLLRALHAIKAEPDRGSSLVQASYVSAAMRRINADFHVSRSPFGRMLSLLRRGEEDGWCRVERRRDDVRVAVRRLPASADGVGEPPKKKYAPAPPPVSLDKKAAGRDLAPQDPPAYMLLVKEWQEKRSEEEIPCYAELVAAWQKTRREAAKREKERDPMDDFYGEVSYVDTKGAPASRDDDNGLRQELDRRAAERRAKEDPPISSRECMRMFDDTLKDVCDEGLYGGLPVNSSVVSARMKRKFARFDQRDTPFERFADLLEEAAREGLVKFHRRGDDILIDWVKYKFKVLSARPRSPPRGRDEVRNRGRRSSRPRGGDRRRSRGRGRGRGDDRRRRSRSRSYSYEYSDYSDYSRTPSPRRKRGGGAGGRRGGGGDRRKEASRDRRKGARSRSRRRR